MKLPILQSPALRAIEAAHAAAEPPLMERAGACAAHIAQGMLAESPGPVLVVAGPGNNGGDARVVARILKAAGHDVQIATAGDAGAGDLPPGDFGLVIDGLFGIGLARPVEGRLAGLIAQINALHAPVLALDVPSGLDAETGQALGPAVRATRTVTFIALKPGLLTGDGPDHCGQISVCDLDLDIVGGDGEQITPDLFADSLRPRRRNSHKGSFGSVGIIGGAAGMAGAALLAGRAALSLGAGRVFVGMLERLPVDTGQPELMLRTPDDALTAGTILAVGPGLGQSMQAVELLMRAIESDLPLVIDADGLNLLTQGTLPLRKLASRSGAVPPAPTLLTPHPAEAARLLGTTTDAVQADRLGAAQTLAKKTQAVVVLKGCGTVVATPGGRWFINPTGNPGLASAGSGDVLTGMLTALLAQHWPPLEAALGAVWLHGAAADVCVRDGKGPIGLAAGELIDAARRLLNELTRDLTHDPAHHLDR